MSARNGGFRTIRGAQATRTIARTTIPRRPTANGRRGDACLAARSGSIVLAAVEAVELPVFGFGELVRRPVEDDPAFAQTDEAREEFSRELKAVEADEEGETALRAQAPQEADGVARPSRVDGGDGFVREEGARILVEGARDRHALSLTAREGVRPLEELLADADAFEDRGDAVEISLGREQHRADRGEESERAEATRDHVLRDAQVRHQREVLVHESDAGPHRPQRGGPQPIEVGIVDEHAAARRLRSAAEEAQECRLARAARSDERESLAGFDDEARGGERPP